MSEHSKEVSQEELNRPLTKEVVKELFDGEEYQYFIAFINGDTEEIVHLVGFEVRPRVMDIQEAIRELKTDEKFGHPAAFVDTLVMRIFSFT